MPFDLNSPVEGAGALVLSAYDKPEPTFFQTLGAAFRQENVIGSAMSSAYLDGPADELSKIDQTYNVYQDPDFADLVKKDPERWETVYNRKAAEVVRSNIQRETKDEATLKASGWVPWLSSEAVATLTDPSILVPGGAMVRSGRIGFDILKSSAAIGIASGIGTAVQEAGLQATQETRTAKTSAMNVGGSVILGGIIGGLGSKFFSKGEWDAVSRQLETDLADDVPNPEALTQTIVQRMQSAGAAASDNINLEDLGIGGSKAAELVARATAAARINPGVQTMLSPSKRVREVYAKMVDNPIMTRMNMEGKTLGADVENLVKLYERGAVASWLKSSRALYRDARKNGFTGTIGEFNTAVARAGRRGDIDEGGNEFVTRAAQEARSKVFDPLLERAKRSGLLPEDVKVTTAASYVTRLWNRQRLMGEETRFRDIARRYFSEQLDQALLRQEERKIGNKVVDTMFVDDRYNKAFTRLQNVEDRLAARQKTRDAMLGRVRGEESRRFDILKDRAPKEVVTALREAQAGDSLVKAVKEARTAENVRLAKTPVLTILKRRGGVRIGSSLDANLRAMGVTPKTVPGLFKKEGGRGSADNIVGSEFELFDSLPTDANGYVDENALMDAIRAEVSGNALRSAAEETQLSNADALGANVSEWLKSVGIDENATIREIREIMAEKLRPEKVLDDVDSRIARLNQEIEDFDKATDGLRNERLVSEAQAKNVAKELQDLEDEINANVDQVKQSPAIKRMVDYARSRRDYGKARYDQTRIKARTDAIKRVDAEGRLTPELEAELNVLAKEAKEVEVRLAKANATSEKLKPFLPKQKEEIPEFVDEGDRADYIEEIVSSVFNNLTGKGAADVPEWIVPVKRGPLKDRVFNIADEQVEDFLENDAELILRRYARTMAAEVELTDRFGRADMQEQLDEIVREYAELRKGAKSAADLEKLNEAEKRDLGNLKAFRDMIRGTYRAADEGSSWSAITRAALTWNYIRMMGGVTLTSITDAASVLGKFGMRATLTEPAKMFAAKLKGNKALRISMEDARELGVVTERVLQSRLANLAELQDPYRYGSTFERFLSNTSNVFTKATGLGYWNDGLRSIVGVMTQNRLMKNIFGALDETTGRIDFAKIHPAEKAHLASLGIDENMAARIADQQRKFGMIEDGIYGPNATQWEDDLAARTWAAALNKAADMTVIMKGVADNPLWMKSNVGKLFFQFKSFMLASHQRVLIAGLQQRQHRLAEQLIFGTTLGMLISYLKYVERGDFDEAERLLENPGLWIANGVDRSGVLSIPFEISNTVEKWGVPGITSAAQLAAGDKDQGGGASRYASRGRFGAIAGPTVGTFEDLTTILDQLIGGDIKKSGVNAAVRQLPGATLPGFRTGINVGLKPALMEGTGN